MITLIKRFLLRKQIKKKKNAHGGRYYKRKPQTRDAEKSGLTFERLHGLLI